VQDGGVVRLVDVLDEAKARALALIQERIASGSTPLTAEEADHAASVLGYGGIKYFDLRQNRQSDYAFSYTRMLSPDGDTAVYLEYAHARMASILRKAKETLGITWEVLVAGLAGMDDAARAQAFTAAHLTELQLAVDLTRWQEVMSTFQQDLMPHRVCEFSYFLCGKFTDFFRDCPVLSSDVPAPLRESRLRLVMATESTLACAMRLLGIEALDKI
jgi:arginyl-tRNA synthetase